MFLSIAVRFSDNIPVFSYLLSLLRASDVFSSSYTYVLTFSFSVSILFFFSYFFLRFCFHFSSSPRSLLISILLPITVSFLYPTYMSIKRTAVWDQKMPAYSSCEDTRELSFPSNDKHMSVRASCDVLLCSLSRSAASIHLALKWW